MPWVEHKDVKYLRMENSGNWKLKKLT